MQLIFLRCIGTNCPKLCNIGFQALTPYIFIFYILSIFAVFNHVKEFRQCRLVFYIIATLLLIFFAGFRQAGVGPDDFNYVDKFLEVPDITCWISGQFKYTFAETWMEPGYIFLGSVVRAFTEDYIFLFTAVAFLSIGISSYNYYRYTPFVFLTLVLFFVHTFLYRDINQIRAGVAAAIGLFLIAQLHEKQRFRALLTIGLAGMFHSAALCLLLAYGLSFFRVTRRRLVIGYFIAFALGFIGISSLLLSILPNLGFLTAKVVRYANSGYADTVSLFDITNIKNSVIFFVMIFYWDFFKYRVRFFETMMLLYFLAVTWRIALSDLGVLAARIATFFGIVEVLLVPALLYLFRQKIFATIVVLIYAFATLYLNLFVKEGRNPYTFSFLIF